MVEYNYALFVFEGSIINNNNRFNHKIIILIIPIIQ